MKQIRKHMDEGLRVCHLSSFADGGSWLSDDRVYAFFGNGGIAEIGYHGRQPVSRNSRVFSGEGGVIGFLAEDRNGVAMKLGFDRVLRHPAAVEAEAEAGGHSFFFRIQAIGRSIIISSRSAPRNRVRIVWDSSGLYGDPQGERTWSEPAIRDSYAEISFRDVIRIGAWMRRSGPYTGDFLLPEAWRRMIFGRKLRAGTAESGDLLPEWRDSAAAVYDSSVFCVIGGPGFDLAPGEPGCPWTWTADSDAQGHYPDFIIRFSDIHSDIDPDLDPSLPKSDARARRASILDRSPELKLAGRPAVENFFASFPALVESCMIEEAGMPRANPGAYYWIWSWDAMVTAMEFPRWGALSRMAAVLRFINSHRDEGGQIPMRWTRDFLPMDAPGRGALEFLYLRLLREYTLLSNDLQPLISAWPFVVQHARECAASADERGFFASLGFYPDMPLRFGRCGTSAVALEIAAHYSFCRDAADCAAVIGDSTLGAQASAHAELIREAFNDAFFDAGRGFYCDSVDTVSGFRNESFPLFSLLFLQRFDSLDLLSGRERRAAAFIAEHHLGSHGLALLPPWDRNRNSEPAAGAWYPHWDLYAVRLWRATGMAGALTRWLELVSRSLETLGYCPEFLMLPPFENGDSDAWLQHGAASNLNCAAGWHRALIEGIGGLRLDEGRIRILPLALQIPDPEFRNISHAGAIWDVKVRYGGDKYRGIAVDGHPIDGCLEVPRRFFDGGRHKLDVIYK